MAEDDTRSGSESLAGVGARLKDKKAAQTRAEQKVADLTRVWRSGNQMPEDAPVDLDDIVRFLRVISRSAPAIVGEGEGVFERLKSHLHAAVPSAAAPAQRGPLVHLPGVTSEALAVESGRAAPLAVASESETTVARGSNAEPPPSRVEPQGGDVRALGEVAQDQVPVGAANEAERALAEPLLHDSRAVSAKGRAESTDRNSLTTKDVKRVVAAVVEEQLREQLDARDRALQARLESMASAQASALSTIRMEAGSAREPIEIMMGRLLNVAQRLDTMSSLQIASREDLLAANASIRTDCERTASLVGDLKSQLSHRIDLNDAKQVMRLRSEIERNVHSDSIREISKFIIPALEVLKASLEDRDIERAITAMNAVMSRCEKAGLVMDTARLF